MTTIILTIIGILLAAAAALMVIFYGGDAFNSGSIGAQANTLQNAGTNVESAATLFKVEQASDATNVGALVTGGYLKEAPALTGVGTLVTDFTDADGDDFNELTVTGVSNEVCLKVNENLAVAPTAIGEGKMGCVPVADDATTGAGASTFYAEM